MSDPIVITGASSGLGRETALLLASKGFHVLATARDASRGAELAAAGGGKIEVLPLELTDPASVRECARQIASRTDRIGALINNAGSQLRGYVEDITDAELRRMFDINFFGVVDFTRQMMPLVRRSGAGTRIVIVTSVSGMMGTHGLGAYCATKFGLEGLAECLRLEMAPLGIHVSTVVPGIVNTDIWGRNKAVGAKAESQDSPNYRLFEESEKWGEWAVKASPIRPIHVAEAIHRAVTDRKPRLRYIVGSRVKLVLALRRHLPGEFFDRIFLHSTARRLKRAASAAGMAAGN
jgi:NAD(P)-dependent dehydrogenase (short-subunit alcohol dehydrogenase family)